MGTSTSVDQFARKLRAVGDSLTRDEASAVRAAALQLKRSVEGQRNRAVGPDGRMSGVGRRGAKLGVRYDMTGDSEALLRATGPWQFIERDTKPSGRNRPRAHQAGRRRRRGGPRALAAPGFGPVAAARNPGTTGKHPFEKGVKKAERKAFDKLADHVTDAIDKVL